MHSPSIYQVLLAISLTPFFPAISALPQQAPASNQKVAAPAPASQPLGPYQNAELAAAGVAFAGTLAALAVIGPNACLKPQVDELSDMAQFQKGTWNPWGAKAPELTMAELTQHEALNSAQESVRYCERLLRKKIDMSRNANMKLLYQGYDECIEVLHKPVLKTEATMPANARRDFCVKRWRLPNVFEPGRLATRERADVRVNVSHRNRMPFRVEEVMRGVQRGAHKLESDVSRAARRLAVPLYRNSPAFLREEEAALFAHGA
ncbi:MAG: hypothetical protein M1826_007488 [Phylliscum demangeonii]|nr:MAG: hypothetical protein M1826_007488 [Phylliscum demangeonii]